MISDPATPSIPTPSALLPGAVSGSPARSLLPETPPLETCLSHQHDFANLNLQHHLSCYLGTSRRDLLSLALDKIKPADGSSFTNFWAKQAAGNNYGSLTSIIACSHYAKQEDLVHCGYSKFKCQDRLLCPLCCFSHLARPVLEEFGGCFGEDNDLFYIVLSLSSDTDEAHRLIFKDVGEDEFRNLKYRGITETMNSRDYGVDFQTGDDLRDCRIMFNLYAEAIRKFTGGKRGCLFSGAVGGPELAVRFQPLRVLPHTNYIVWSPGFSADSARKLRKLVREKMRNCRPLQTRLFPSVACYRLRSSEDLRRVVNYIFKPINLAAAYLSAAERINYVPASMVKLNLETNAFLQNVMSVFWHLRRLSRYGRCHASHHAYFGHVTECRREQRERNAERRASMDRDTGHGSGLRDVARWEKHYFDQLDRPAWPRQSRYSIWKSRNERPPPRPPNRTSPKRGVPSTVS